MTGRRAARSAGARRGEAGSAGALGLQLVTLLVVVALACAAVVAYLVAHRRSQAAADLAALAGASALQQGQDPCASAADIAGRNRARLLGCVVEGQTVLVTASVATGRLPTLLGGAQRWTSGEARAGPVDPSP